MGIASAHQEFTREFWNTPVSYVRRTPRELLCYAVGLTLMAAEMSQPAHGMLFYGNLAMAVVGTMAFAARFFLARVLATAAAFGAGAQWWLARRVTWSTAFEQNWRAYACLLVIGVLASGDLVRRFDRGPGFFWWPNTWAALRRVDLALLRWSIYVLCILVALIMKGRGELMALGLGSRVAWVSTYVGGVAVVCALVGFGRKPALLLLPLIHLWGLLELIPEPASTGTAESAPPIILARMSHAARPGLIIAMLGVGVSVLLASRYLRRRLTFPET